MNLRRKYFFSAGLVLVILALVLALLYYRHMRSVLINEALDKSAVVLEEVEAIRGYVKDELRPVVSSLVGRDRFVIEAMSSTYVSLRIMERFGQKMDGIRFRRVSLNPLNPDNMADSYEEEMFDWFDEHPEKRLWQGIVNKDGQDFFVSILPDYFETGCLKCHGDPGQVPRELIKRYGTRHGYRFVAGELGGLDSIWISVARPLALARRDSLVVFVVILAAVLAALFVLHVFFDRLVLSRLTHISSLLLEDDEETGGPRKAALPSGTGRGDELERLRLSLKTLARYVRIARKGADLAPDFVGRYAVGRPMAMGTLSWLYKAVEAGGDSEVILKLPQAEIMDNPIYAACFRAEVKMMRAFKHENMVTCIGREGEGIVLDPVDGTDLAAWFQEQRGNWQPCLPVIGQICDLVASLHSFGIVHHDLRPALFFLEAKQKVRLFDLGYAHWRELPDLLASSGVGPIGDYRYMAPELLRGERGDPRSDIYSLGMLVYLAAAGTLPFAEEKTLPDAWLERKKELPPLRQLRPDISKNLENVLARALAWKPEKRYQWVEDFWHDLAACLEKTG